MQPSVPVCRRQAGGRVRGPVLQLPAGEAAGPLQHRPHRQAPRQTEAIATGP